MGYLSVITVHFDKRTIVRQSKNFGVAVDTATVTKEKHITLGRVVVGRVMRTAHANNNIELYVDALPTGLLSIAWVYHDELNVISADPSFGQNFAEAMEQIPEMVTEKQAPVDAHAHRSACTGAYVFFTLAPGYRARVLMHGNLAEVMSYTVLAGTAAN